jgi:hypothetical protein
MVKMKKVLVITLVTLSIAGISQNSPSFLDGYDYTKSILQTKSGEEFTAYEYRVRDNKSFRELNKRFKKLNHRSTWVEKGIVFTERENNCYTVVRGWAWGFRTFGVYYN